MATQPQPRGDVAPPAPMRVEHIVARFAALCVPCEWEGDERSDSRRALADFDRHVLTLDHELVGVQVRLKAEAEADNDGEEAGAFDAEEMDGETFFRNG